MELAPYNMKNWQEYISWYAQRDEPPPPPPRNAVFVTHEGETIIGCCYYLGDPPYMYFEHLCSNPKASPSVTHRAFTFCVRAVMAMGTFENRIVLIFARHKGIINILQKCGFKQNPCVVFYAAPGAEIKSPPVRDTDRGQTGVDGATDGEEDETADGAENVPRKTMSLIVVSVS